MRIRTARSENIAGIVNVEGNVLGMMPHPERCAEDVLGNDAGRADFYVDVGGAKEDEAADQDGGAG